MENFEHTKEEKEDEADPSRRKFLQILGGLGATFFCGGMREALAQEGNTLSRYGEKWFFSLAEMQAVYDREYNGEKILKNCFRNEGGRIIGMFHGKDILIPQEFVDRVLRNLREMLEIGAARYIFRLDASHGHAFMNEKLYTQRYGDRLRDVVEQTRALVSDPNVGILYHNSEHLDLKSGDSFAQSLIQKRNVITRNNDTAIEIMPLPKAEKGKKTAQNTPKDTKNFNASIEFAAHKDGVFALKFGNKEIRLDLSLDDPRYY